MPPKRDTEDVARIVMLSVIFTIAIVMVAWFYRLGSRQTEVSDFVAPKSEVRATSPQMVPLTVLETDHYVIESRADTARTRTVAEAVESLYRAYFGFFGPPRRGENAPKLKLRLYASRSEFKAYNRSAPWAEAFYSTPYCHAYYADGEPNPYHWMIHEATHQLSKEVSRFEKRKWIDEGLATYLGTSRIEGGELRPGIIDVHTYPVWRLRGVTLSGNLRQDLEAGSIIPLRALITGIGGPDIDYNFNRYYVGYWSLTHFLFHYRNGKYAEPYRSLIESGGSLERFEALIGPVDTMESEWYGYLQQLVSKYGGNGEPEQPVPRSVPEAG